MKILKAFASVVLSAFLILILQIKLGNYPPIGKFLNPIDGFWQNAENDNTIRYSTLDVKGLKSSVTIKFDNNRVPHIFADNDYDLYFAQGYVTATDRLWQMDLQIRTASGRLSEIFGKKTLSSDRYQRRIGMLTAAEKSLGKIMKDPKTRQMIEAYSNGVNAYISQLSGCDYPLEFKIFDYKPEPYKPINCVLFLKLMCETLTGGSDQFAMSNVLTLLGDDIVKELYPDYPYRNEPAIPEGSKWGFKRIDAIDSAVMAPSTAPMHKTVPKIEGIGSNNWVISGKKTRSGYPILANDPHLNLSFPSTWYQLQLSSPGVNVNGVTFPCVPNIIIGYNQFISWGVTNADIDVFDWYQLRFKDNKKNEYLYNGGWRKIQKKPEIIKIRGEKDYLDTVLYTHHGPIVFEDAANRPKNRYSNVPSGSSLRWIGHEASNEFKAFYLLNRATNYTEYRQALSYYSSPAQTFAFASVNKDIALNVSGQLPLKYKNQGKFILEGSSSKNDWKGWIPNNQNPEVKNPKRGFVSSANQTLTDTTYPYYLNWQFAPYERAKRINDRLKIMEIATVDSMRSLQNDTYSISAQDALPAMLAKININQLNDNQKLAYNSLKQWNRFFDEDKVAAIIFVKWWDKFYHLTWDNKFGEFLKKIKLPSRDKTVELLIKDPDSKWFDNHNTSQKRETGKDIVNQAFVVVVDQLTKTYGAPNESWRWGHQKRYSINHLARIPGLGIDSLPAVGFGSAVNALDGNHGPSWRMVVEMGPVIRGYGVIPGGQSGNPGSYYYDNMFQAWKEGKLYELVFLSSSSEVSPKIISTLVLNKK